MTASRLQALRTRARLWVRGAGFDVVPYRHDSHPLARRARLLAHHGVDLVVDVGANTGQYAQELRKIGYRGRIVSYEPLAEAHAALARAARADDRWDVVRAAMGADDGTITLHVAANSVSSSVLPILERHVTSAPASRFLHDEDVPIVAARRALTSLAAGARHPFLKLDVQGFERHILEAAGDALDAYTGVQLEMSLVPLYDGEALMPELQRLLQERGLQLMALEPGYTDPASGQLLQVDGVYFRPASAPHGG